MSTILRLTTITFRAGAVQGQPPLTVTPDTVTVLVGPNNSGKSLTLREIEQWCMGQEGNRRVLDTLDAAWPTDAPTARALLDQFVAMAPPGMPLSPGQVFITRPARIDAQADPNSSARERAQSFSPSTLDDLFAPGVPSAARAASLRQHLLALYTIRLDGRTRFWLVSPQRAGDLLQTAPQNHLWALFKDDATRRKVGELTAEAFGQYFVIDATGMQNFRVRMSSAEPTTEIEEQGLGEQGRRFQAAAPLITDLGDGVQAFVGLVSAVLSLPDKIILIDEPEAFLHPPLARRLGRNLASIATEREASLVVATHSADYLIGSLEAVSDITVLRLTFERGVPTARSLSPNELRPMMRDPLLRSTGIIDALFHRGAVVTEADPDRAFYDEMNRRLEMDGRGASDIVFLHAQGKSSVPKLVSPLRRIGVPAAAIVDLDIIKSGHDWARLMEACNLDALRRAALEAERAHLSAAFESLKQPSQPEPLKARGVTALPTDDFTRADELLKAVAEYGLFVVPVGEVESWLAHMGIDGHGGAWLVKIFEKIGQSEGESGYMRAGRDDVWQFLESITQWLENPNRSGV